MQPGNAHGVSPHFTDSWYWIGALLVPERVSIALTTALDTVMAEAAKVHALPADAELHGYDMFHGRLVWRDVTPRVRIAIYNAAMKAIGAHDVTIILRGVDRAGLAKRYASPKPAHDVVLSHLLERVDAYAAKEQQLALVIADEVDNPARHRADLTRYRTDGTGGYRSRHITRIVDTLHFAPSHSSRLVQAVDLVTFLHRRLTTVTEVDRRASAANERMWSWVQSRVYHSWCWYPERQTQRQTHKGPA